MRGDQAGAGGHLAVEVQFGITAAVEADGGPHHPVDQVEADQLAVGHAAPDHELVPRGDVAGVLDLVLVLIGPERVEVVVRRRGAEHGPGHGGALLLRVVVVLDPDPPEQRVEVVGDIAGRVHVGRAGPAQLVGQDPVLLRDREAVQDVGCYADARHGEVARDTVTGRGHDGLHAFGALEGRHLFSGSQLDALLAVDGADHRADLAAQDPFQRILAREERGHPDAELGQRGRHLAADEAHAHDDRAPARHRLLLDRVAFGHRAQVVKPGQAGPGEREPPVASPGGDQDLLIAELFAGGQGDGVRAGIDGRDGFAAALDVVAGVPAGRPDVPAVEILLRPQVGLGQRRAAEGEARFPADEHDRPGETLVPQRRGGVAPGQAAADDHDRVSCDPLGHAVDSALRALQGDAVTLLRTVGTLGVPAPR